MKQIDFARPEFDEREKAAVQRVLDGVWLASGKENEAFEKEFAEYIGVPYALCVNSGSSANLLALASLGLGKDKKVITSACGFPATLSPILHCGLEPVLVDYDIPSHNISINQLVLAMKDKSVGATIFAHTMGVPVDMGLILKEAKANNVFVIEDCCEAIGAEWRGQQVGSIGDIGTFSFYPSHQITALGGGGMITFKHEEHYRRAKSLRDWGKMSNWDAYGQNDTAYDTEVDGMMYFKHYAYETIGFNMKLPEANAAFGREQLRKLDRFVDTRDVNHMILDQYLKKYYGDVLTRHVTPSLTMPSWFGFVITLNKGDRNKLGDFLEQNGVKHRPFFAGNITRHKPFESMKAEYPVADRLMKDSLFVGCHQHLLSDDMKYVADIIISGIEAQR